jgi:hypothetical protein
MPPRHTYWTILIDNAPTAFRSATREELQPTFERLRSRHPSAVMRWFARGRVWASPEEAEQAARAARERRGPSWRPGGSHRDPREAARQQRKAKNADRRAERFERRQAREQSRGAGTAGGHARSPRPPEHVRGGAAKRPAREAPRFDDAARKNKGSAAGRSRPSPQRRPQPRPREVPRPAREKPPKPPFGPGRPPRPGQEPTPEPVRPEEIVVPHDPPERGTAGPDGSRLVKRRRS